MKYDFSNIPDDLQEQDRWILWRSEKRGGDTTKSPYQPGGSYAKTNDPGTWITFENACETLRDGDFDGIGFVFTEEGPFVGADLDDCVKDGKLSGGAWKIVRRLDSYTELSPSGTGLHIICRGFLPDLGHRSEDVKGLKELELYEEGRYFTFTGHHLEDTPREVEQRAQELYDLCQDVFDEPDPEPIGATGQVDVEDEKLIERAKQADDGKFSRLWNGDTSAYGDDHSRADLALVSKLAFWTGGDRDRIDRLFRQSGLCREKWTERTDYRKRTIDEALENQTEFYDPSNASEQQADGGRESSHDEVGGAPDPWEAIRTTYEKSKKKARVQATKKVLGEMSIAMHRKSGQTYAWNPDKKIFEDNAEQKVKELLVRKLNEHHSRSEQEEIFEKARLRSARDEFGGEYVPVANGDLFLDDGSVSLKDADPERGPLARSPAAWDPNAQCKCFQSHIQALVRSESERKTFQEYVGYCLMHWGIPYHKALFVVGPTASGKSTALTAIRNIIGRVVKLKPQQIVNGRFGAADLQGAWANVRSDISSALLKDVGLFKEVVGGDPIYVERKHQQGFNLRPTAKHIYSANQLPEIQIDDDAFFRRVLIVSFPTTIPREERVNREELDARLRSEKDGILKWAVEGLLRLEAQGGFTHDLGPKETRKRWAGRASSIGQFKSESLTVTGDSEDFIPKGNLYDAYTEFCKERGLGQESKRKVTRVLKRDPGISDAQRTPEGASRQVRCYVGIKMDVG